MDDSKYPSEMVDLVRGAEQDAWSLFLSMQPESVVDKIPESVKGLFLSGFTAALQFCKTKEWRDLVEKYGGFQ